MPEPLRNADYKDVQNMSDQEFRTRLLYELQSLHRMMLWQGSLNSALLSILIAVGIAIFTGRIAW